jgi:transcription elongation factor GreA
MSGKVPMTREGFLKLTTELERMKRVERQKAITDISVARGHGDITENAEYDAAKERQAFIEGRIREIENKLANAQVIDTKNLPSDRIVFGATVRLSAADNGQEVSYRIVGEDEADVKNGKISVTSPVGQALIGKELNDTVQVRAPGGVREYEILEIRYED